MYIFTQNRSPVIRSAASLVLLWCLIGLAANAGAAPADFPFQPGEKIVYKLRWGIIPAGSATLEVLPFRQINGEKAWHFVMSVETSEFVDLFYKVRDRIESLTDPALANSLLYTKKQREGSVDQDVVVRFDPVARSVVYSNREEVHDTITIRDGTIDPLAAIYYIRKQPLAENIEIVRPVSDGKKLVDGVARVIRREVLDIDGIAYDTFLVEPDLKEVRGVFEKSKNAKLELWITNDERRLLVKMRSKVLVGSFTGTLEEASFSR